MTLSSSAKKLVRTGARVIPQCGHYAIDQFFQEISRLLTASPIRSEGEKSDIVPLFVARDNSGYLIITVPQMPASKQTGSDEFERRITPNYLQVLSHAGEL